LCDPNSFSVANIPKSFYKHLFPALLAGLLLRLFFIWRFLSTPEIPLTMRNSAQLVYHGVYGFYSHGQLLPSDARAPGFWPPGHCLFLGRPRQESVMLVQAFVDLATCVLAAGIAGRLAAGKSEASRARVAAQHLAGGALPLHGELCCGPLTEVLATFFTTLAILIFLFPAFLRIDLVQSESDILGAARSWLMGGVVVGLGTLVRPEAPLLLVAVLLMLGLRYYRPEIEELALASLCVVAGLTASTGPMGCAQCRESRARAVPGTSLR